MFIKGLDDIEQKICELRYKEKCSYEAIGNVICTDRRTARRKLLIIHEKLVEELGLIAYEKIGYYRGNMS